MEDKRAEFETLIETILERTLLLKHVYPMPLPDHYNHFVQVIFYNAERLQTVIRQARDSEPTYKDFIVLLSYDIGTVRIPIEANVRLILITCEQQLSQPQRDILREIQTLALQLLDIFKQSYRSILDSGDHRGYIQSLA